jgi:ferredoxin
MLVNLLFSNLIYKHSAKHIAKMDKNFWVDKKCNKCGICEKICPVCNIDMKVEIQYGIVNVNSV